MAAEILKTIEDETGVVDEGESCVITATLYDTSGDQLVKDSIATLACTLTDAAGTTINSRSGQDILDTNGGTLATDGTLTLLLGPSDNTIVVSSLTKETHHLLLTWTWQDDEANTLTGRQEFQFFVQNLVGA